PRRPPLFTCRSCLGRTQRSRMAFCMCWCASDSSTPPSSRGGQKASRRSGPAWPATGRTWSSASLACPRRSSSRRHGCWGARAARWCSPAAGASGSAYRLFSSLGEPDGVRALLVVGSNPVVSAPDAGRIEARLRSLDFLAVSDFFLSETAALAHVVLPSAQWAEEEGTMTNLEGRVVRRRRAQPPPPGARTDVEVLCDIAARLGHAHRFTYAGPREVFEELRRASKGGPADYSGISYEKIDTQG